MNPMQAFTGNRSPIPIMQFDKADFDNISAYNVGPNKSNKHIPSNDTTTFSEDSVHPANILRDQSMLSTAISKSSWADQAEMFLPSEQQQFQKNPAANLESFKHSGDISNSALISDHDCALLDALGSPKPHKSAFSSGSKTTTQKQKFSVAKRHEPSSAKRLKRHEPL